MSIMNIIIDKMIKPGYKTRASKSVLGITGCPSVEITENKWFSIDTWIAHAVKEALIILKRYLFPLWTLKTAFGVLDISVPTTY